MDRLFYIEIIQVPHCFTKVNGQKLSTKCRRLQLKLGVKVNILFCVLSISLVRVHDDNSYFVRFDSTVTMQLQVALAIHV